jgi:hypothetical protein
MVFLEKSFTKKLPCHLATPELALLRFLAVSYRISAFL